jgi:hypothetical protein
MVSPVKEGYDMSWEEDERRVAEIIGVQAGQRLPAVSKKTLRQYHAYLTAHLVFPFQAAIEDMDGVITIKSLFNVSSLPIMEKGEQFLWVIGILALLCSHYKISL